MKSGGFNYENPSDQSDEDSALRVNERTRAGYSTSPASIPLHMKLTSGLLPARAKPDCCHHHASARRKHCVDAMTLIRRSVPASVEPIEPEPSECEDERSEHGIGMLCGGMARPSR